MITEIIGVAITPWKLIANPNTYIFDWLVGYSALLGPIARIMIVDFRILRRRELDVPDLYRTTGRYAGVNSSAMIALCLAIAPNVPGFLKATHVIAADENFFDTLYTFAWFVGFLVAGAMYFAMELRWHT